MNQIAKAIQQQVRKYHEQGLTAVPAEYGSKGKGLPRGYLDTTHDQVDLNSWGEVPKNVYVLLGSKSNNLVDIDLDCPEARSLYPMFVEGQVFPETAMFGRSEDITHAVFQTEVAAKSSEFSSPSGGMLVEIRGERQGTIFPPSKHEGTGTLLQWQSKDINPTPVSVEEVKIKTGQLAAASLLAKEWPRERGRRNELAMAVAGCFLRSEGLSAEFVKQMLQKIACLGGDEEFHTRGDVAKHTADKLKAEEQATGLPKLAEILGQGVTDKVSEWLGLSKNTKDSWGGPLIDFTVSLSELLRKEYEPVEYLIYPIFKRPSLSMLFGPRGIGKTWATYYVAQAIADGADWFKHRNPNPPRNVLIIDGEMAESEIQSRLRRMGIKNLENIRLLSSERLYLEDHPIHLHNVLHQERINELIDALESDGWKPDMVILDNLSSMSGGTDENSNSDQDGFMQLLIGLRHRRISVLLVHHAGKNGTQRGASRREDILDTVIQLSPPPERDGEDASHHIDDGPCFHVDFTKTRGPTPVPKECNVHLRLEGEVWTPHVEAVSNISTADKVLRTIYDYGPILQKEIGKILGVGKSTVSKAVKVLVGEDSVQRPGKRGDPLRFDFLGKERLVRAYPELAEEAEKQFPDIM